MAEAASQGLVIGVGGAIVALLGLLMAAIYKMHGDTRDDLRGLRQTTETGFDRLRADFGGINREVGELKVRLEYVGAVPREGAPAATSVAPPPRGG
jgi:hypothetical protein